MKDLWVDCEHNGSIYIYEGCDPSLHCEVVVQMSPLAVKKEGPFDYLKDANARLVELKMESLPHINNYLEDLGEGDVLH